MKKVAFSLLILLAVSSNAFGKMNVVVTLPWIGSVVEDIGKGKVVVKSLVKPNQDPHMIEAKPSMILATRDADLFLFNGLDLEIGYVGLLVESSRNPRIQPGQPGHVNCSSFVEVIERQVSADRSMGDVHPLGNPHYHLSPTNVGKVAAGIVAALTSNDPPNSSYYRDNHFQFQKKLEAQGVIWSGKRIRGKKFVAYHKFFEYLAAEYQFQIIGYVEPKPGIPPSAAHVEQLVSTMKLTKPDGILSTGYYGKKEVEFLSKQTGVRGIIVPHDVGSAPGIKDWFSLMNAVLSSLE
jgi:zinc/manganese transport system substrate-binding protein